MQLLADPQVWLSFLTLAVLEIVLGIDNVIFLSMLVDRLPNTRRGSARILGLSFAMLTRIALLFSITWLATLRAPLFAVLGMECVGPRIDSVRRRPVPDREERQRNPRHARRKSAQPQGRP